MNNLTFIKKLSNQQLKEFFMPDAIMVVKDPVQTPITGIDGKGWSLHFSGTPFNETWAVSDFYAIAGLQSEGSSHRVALPNKSREWRIFMLKTHGKEYATALNEFYALGVATHLASTIEEAIQKETPASEGRSYAMARAARQAKVELEKQSAKKINYSTLSQRAYSQLAISTYSPVLNLLSDKGTSVCQKMTEYINKLTTQVKDIHVSANYSINNPKTKS